MIRMFVFDMAGTVIDEDNVVYKTLLKAVNEQGYGLSLEAVLLEGAGKEKFTAIKDILQKHAQVDNIEIIEKIFWNFKMYLEIAYDSMEIMPHAGAKELFTYLRSQGILVVLNTGYDTRTAHSLLRKVGWVIVRDIDAVITASDVTHNRPHPDMIDLAKRKFSLVGSQIIKVGDSIIDIEEGKNAGCLLNIGITTGAQSREQLALAKPDLIIDNLLEIIPAVDKSLG